MAKNDHFWHLVNLIIFNQVRSILAAPGIDRNLMVILVDVVNSDQFDHFDQGQIWSFWSK